MLSKIPRDATQATKPSVQYIVWKINWISSWKEIAVLYSILVVVIMISTLTKIGMRKILG